MGLLPRFRQRREDTLTAFLRRSSITQLNSQLLAEIKERGFSYATGNVPEIIALLNPKGRIVALLQYSTTISGAVFLDKIMVPDPEGSDGQTIEHYTGTLECDRRLLDTIDRLLGVYGVTAQPVRTTDYAFGVFGMKTYYPVLEQYRTRLESQV